MDVSAAMSSTMIFQHHHHHHYHHPSPIAHRHSPMGCSRILVGGRPEAGWQESKWCFLGDPLACSSAHVEGLSVFCTFGVSHVHFLGHPDIDHDHNHDNNMPLLLQNPNGMVSNQFCKHCHSWIDGSLSDCSSFFFHLSTHVRYKVVVAQQLPEHASEPSAATCASLFRGLFRRWYIGMGYASAY